MLENLTQLGYLAMTPIQAASLPTALAGKDLVTYLQEQGFNALALYGELEQRERDQVLAQTADAGYTREQIGKIKFIGALRQPWQIAVKYMVTVSCTFKATQATFQIGPKLAGSTQVPVLDKAFNSRQLVL